MTAQPCQGHNWQFPPYNSIARLEVLHCDLQQNFDAFFCFSFQCCDRLQQRQSFFNGFQCSLLFRLAHCLTTSVRINPIMRRFGLYLVLLALALVVVGISVAILRVLHHSIPLYVLLIPIWVTVLVVLVRVAWVTLRVSQNGDSE